MTGKQILVMCINYSNPALFEEGFQKPVPQVLLLEGQAPHL